MPTSDVFGMPTTILSKISFVRIDAVLNESHVYENLVTEHPAEDGSPLTDNVVNLPVSVEMTGRITDTPSTVAGSLISGAAGLLATQLGVPPAVAAGGSALLGLSLPGRAKTAFQELVALYATRETFDVLTGLNEYTNMVFRRLEFMRDPGDGRSIRFRAQLKEIVIGGDDAISNASRLAEGVQNSAASPVNLGQLAMQTFGGS